MDDSASIARRTGLAELDVHLAELFDAARAGEFERGRALVSELVLQDERWHAYLRALADLEYLPNAAELLPEE